MQIKSRIFTATLVSFLSVNFAMLPCVQAEGLFLTPSNETVRNPFPQERSYATPSLNSRSIALEALKQGQTRQALVLLESWVDDHPEDLDAFFHLAKAHYQLGDFVAMRRYLATLKTLAPQDAVTRNALAWASTVPESKAPTADDEKNRALLNVARSVAEAKTLPSPFSAKPMPKPAFPETNASQVKSIENTTTNREETTTIPVVKEATVEEKNSSPTMQNTAQSTTQNKSKIPNPSSSTVGAAATVQTPSSTTPLTQEQIDQNFQMLQQLMMMQMMSNSQNGMNTSNPMAMMMNGQGMNGMNALNMMNGQSGLNPTMNPQMMNQMMQNSLLNNMNGMFNTNNDNQNNNNSGFGF
jgi:hypothetical protein